MESFPNSKMFVLYASRYEKKEHSKMFVYDIQDVEKAINVEQFNTFCLRKYAFFSLRCTDIFEIRYLTAIIFLIPQNTVFYSHGETGDNH